MAGEINSFRSRFFGGFNRGDVVEYIEKLSKERNEMEAAKIKAEDEVRALTPEIERFRSEAEEARRLLEEDRDRLAGAFKSAGNAFAEYEDEFKKLCEEMNLAAANLSAELKKAVETTARMPPMLSRAAERLEELRSEFDAGENKAVSDRGNWR